MTTYLVSSMRVMTVSGWASTRWMSSALSTKCSPLRRVRRITEELLGSGAAVAVRGVVAAALRCSAGRRRCLSGAARSPPWGDRAAQGCAGSAAELHQALQDLVGGGDDAAVRLEPALGDDQVGELRRQVDVGHLQR